MAPIKNVFTYCKKFGKQKGTLLTTFTISGVFIGFGVGLGLRELKSEPWSQRSIMYLRFIGDVFIRTIGGLVLPLIFSTLVSAMGSMDLSVSKKIGIRALVFYTVTSFLAAFTGVIIAIVIGPGYKGEDEGGCTRQNITSTVDSLLDLVRNIFPSNLVGAAIQNTKTEVIEPDNSTIPFEEWPIRIKMIDGTNMLGLMIFAMVLGVTLSQMKEEGKPLLRVFSSMSNAMMIITTKVVLMAPVAVCFLMIGVIVQLKDIGNVFRKLAWFSGTVTLASCIHGFVILPLLYVIFTRKMPFRYLMNMSDALAVAFGASSSAVTLPFTLKCLEDYNKIDPRITRFIIPIGANINMDGTAVYLTGTVVYLAQLCGQTLSFGQLLVICFVAVGVSAGAAPIPGTLMIILITALNSVGLPTDKVVYVLAVDWFFERLRTVVNVTGDAFVAGVINHVCRSDLKKVPPVLVPVESGETISVDELDAKSCPSEVDHL